MHGPSTAQRTVCACPGRQPCAPPCARPSYHKDSLDELQTADPQYRIPYTLIHAFEPVVILLYLAQQFFNIPHSHSGMFMSKPSPSGFSGDSRLVSVVDLLMYLLHCLPNKCKVPGSSSSSYSKDPLPPNYCHCWPTTTCLWTIIKAIALAVTADGKNGLAPVLPRLQSTTTGHWTQMSELSGRPN